MCPRCKSKNRELVTYFERDWNDGIYDDEEETKLSIEYECLDCKTAWKESYVLFKMEVL